MGISSATLRDIAEVLARTVVYSILPRRLPLEDVQTAALARFGGLEEVERRCLHRLVAADGLEEAVAAEIVHAHFLQTPTDEVWEELEALAAAADRAAGAWEDQAGEDPRYRAECREQCRFNLREARARIETILDQIG